MARQGTVLFTSALKLTCAGLNASITAWRYTGEWFTQGGEGAQGTRSSAYPCGRCAQLGTLQGVH